MEKTASKKWRESGSTLTFKEWIERENQKKNGSDSKLSFDAVNANVDTTAIVNQALQDAEDSPIRTTEDKSKIFGLDKTIFVFSTILIVGSLGYYFYNKVKNKK